MVKIITATELLLLEVSEEFQSDLKWLFAGGDIIEGPDVIHGIANGYRSAKGIDRYLNK